MRVISYAFAVRSATSPMLSCLDSRVLWPVIKTFMGSGTIPGEARLSVSSCRELGALSCSGQQHLFLDWLAVFCTSTYITQDVFGTNDTQLQTGRVQGMVQADDVSLPSPTPLMLSTSRGGPTVPFSTEHQSDIQIHRRCQVRSSCRYR